MHFIRISALGDTMAPRLQQSLWQTIFRPRFEVLSKYLTLQLERAESVKNFTTLDFGKGDIQILIFPKLRQHYFDFCLVTLTHWNHPPGCCKS